MFFLKNVLNLKAAMVLQNLKMNSRRILLQMAFLPFAFVSFAVCKTPYDKIDLNAEDFRTQNFSQEKSETTDVAKGRLDLNAEDFRTQNFSKKAPEKLDEKEKIYKSDKKSGAQKENANMSSLKESIQDSEGEGSDDDFEASLYEDEMDDIYDPLEPFNRLMFTVNDALDKAFMTPLAMTYKHVLPRFAQIAIENLASHFFSPVRVINFALQGDGEQVVKTVFRFIINTFLGFLGTIDAAEKMGLSKKDTSFGDTLKKWGAKPGPYIVLPIFGPSSFRGATGKVMQMPIDPIAQISLLHYKKNTRKRIYYTIYGFDLIAKRASVLSLMNELERISEDKYVSVRRTVMTLENKK